MDENRIAGRANVGVGRFQAEVGRMTGDPDMWLEGVSLQGKGHAQAALGQARETMRDAADRASGYVEVAVDEGRRRVAAGTAALNLQVETNPVMAILTAAAVGYVVGLMVRRNGR